MDEAQHIDTPLPLPAPAQWVDEHGDYLYKYACFRLRDPALAEDIVQETLLAAIQAYKKFAGRGSERTWLVGILKHKIIDQYRRTSRLTLLDLGDSQSFEHDEFFHLSGTWTGHWQTAVAPTDWRTNPADVLQQGEFLGVFQKCLEPLPERTARAFTLREVDGLTSEEICETLSVTANNLWVMLHRARLHLRRCIEVKWFMREKSKS
jgi:RNA polymerase sigma-70 factor (TIGR02943 family)